MIKAAFFDFDGTLFSHRTKCIPDSTKLALNLLKEQGILVCLCTGRSSFELKEFPIDDVCFDAKIVMNGEVIYGKDNEFIYNMPIEGNDKQLLLNLFNEKRMCVSITEIDQIYCNFHSATLINTLKEVNTTLVPIGEYTGNKIYQFSIFPANDEELKYAKANIGNCEIFSWEKHGFDIIAPGQSKAHGLEVYCQKFGIDPKECISFGDAQNDEPMMKSTGISVCMGNGDEPTKKAASYITDDIDENGIYNALKHFNII